MTAIKHGLYTYDPETPAGAAAAPIDPDGGGEECENEWVDHTDPATGKFVWKVYKNLGGGTFDSAGVKVLAPVALDAAGGDSFVTRDRSIYAPGGDSTGLFDLDGDSKVDIVVSGGSSWQLHRGVGNGTFASPITWPAPPNISLAKFTSTPSGGAYRYINTTQSLMDVTGDGLADLLVSNSTGIDAYLNNGAGFDLTFAAPELAVAGRQPFGHQGVAGHGRRDDGGRALPDDASRRCRW